jgi:hypothetical protein
MVDCLWVAADGLKIARKSTSSGNCLAKAVALIGVLPGAYPSVPSFAVTASAKPFKVPFIRAGFPSLRIEPTAR